MKRLMKRLKELEKRAAIAAEQREDNESNRRNAVLRQVRRMALRSMTLKDLYFLRDVVRSGGRIIEFTAKQLAAVDRFRTFCEHFARELSGQPFATIEQTVKPDELALARKIDCELATRNFSKFTKQAWDVVEPAKPFIDNWHIDCIAAHLAAVTRGQIRKLLINVPPGCAKSLLVAVLWPAWVWIQPDSGPGGPKWRVLCASYAAELSYRDSIRCRLLIESDWYQQTFEPKWTLSDVQNAKGHFMNTEMGSRLATSVSGRGTGFRGDAIICDDPLNAKEAHSPAAREEVIRWWDHVMPSRLNDKQTGARVIIMQRLHELDLSGRILEQGGYEHLCIPMEFEPERRFVTCLGQDLREDPGELLFEELFPPKVIAETKREMGAAEYAGQYQQRPSPEGGGILKRYWWRYWQPKGAKLSPIMVRMPNGELKAIEAVELPANFNETIQSWDCSFKDLKASDYVTGGIWGRKGADTFLLDQLRDRLDCPGTMQAIRNMTVKHPRAQAKLIEGKANGPAVIQMLHHEISGLIEVEPEGGKIARAYAVSPQIEAGNVYLPHPSIAPWVDPFIAECTAFPNGAHDDQVDQMTQALNRLRNGPRANVRILTDSWEEGLP